MRKIISITILLLCILCISTSFLMTQEIVDLGDYTATGRTDSLFMRGFKKAKFQINLTHIDSLSLYMEGSFGFTYGNKRWSNLHTTADTTYRVSADYQDSTFIMTYEGWMNQLRFNITKLVGGAAKNVEIIAAREEIR